MNSPQAVAVVAPELTPVQAWGAHIRKAVLQFLKTAVVVDNEPGLTASNAAVVAPAALVLDSGLDSGDYVAVSPESNLENKNVLEIRKISDSFSEEGIACAFVLPDKEQDEVGVRRRVLLAAKTADILIIDWHLSNETSSLTLQLLREIAISDARENGRMRLTCIYTGESLDDQMFAQAKEYLSVDGAEYNNIQGVAGFDYCAKSKTSLLVLASKDTISADSLPANLIDSFAELAKGLVPSFALAGIGSIRKNTHHMLTRFSSSIDSAYVANRLITNPPGDVAELMRELLVAECDNALGLDCVADEYLERKAISLWLDVSSEQFQFGKFSDGKKDIQLTKDMIDGLLVHGIRDKDFTDASGADIKFPEFARNKISDALSGGREQSKISENEFSRLVLFRREAYGPTTRLINPRWLPSLTTGTVLKYFAGEGAPKYLMCFTPACDALRLTVARPFVFLEGVAGGESYNTVLIEDGGAETGVYFDKKYPVVRTFEFIPDGAVQRVRARRVDNGSSVKYTFTSAGDSPVEFEWLGEIRYSRAASEVAALANVWMRIGILDSEYLRIAAKGHFKF